MTKTQRLRNAAEGFMAGLVLAGFEGPFRWAHHQWEGPFMRAWNRWGPRADTAVMPSFQVGGTGRQSQGRDMLWQLARTSPFHDFASEPLNQTPRGLDPAEYIEISVEGADADQWRELAEDFLAEMEALGY